MRKRHLFLSFTAFTVVFLASLDVVKAIPAFARKYKTSCQTCHTMIFRRNALGEAFRRNGYFMPVGEEEMVKDPPVKLGAEERKELWPQVVWPGSISPSVPFSAYVHQRTVWEFSDSDDSKDNKITFDAPHEFELYGGNRR